jgi:hypothetical protein
MFFLLKLNLKEVIFSTEILLKDNNAIAWAFFKLSVSFATKDSFSERFN